MMKLVIAQPERILYEASVRGITYEAEDGARGVLPDHIDLVTSLAPGILIVMPKDRKLSRQFFALDQGVVVKRGKTLTIVTRRGVQGEHLAGLRETVEKDYRRLDAQEARSRGALHMLEADFLRQFVEMESPDDERFG